MYIGIILTVNLILINLILWSNIPNKKEIKEAKRKQDIHNEYQVRINNEVLELHIEMITILERIERNTI